MADRRDDEVWDRLKLALYRGLKRPAIEGVISGLHGLEGVQRRAWLRELLVKCTPHPEVYGRDEVRSVSLDGLNWEFRPYNYFQWHQYFRQPDPLLAVLEALVPEGEVFVDVGANVGYYSVRMSRRARCVYAIEPNPISFTLLLRHVALNRAANVRALRVAVGEEQSSLLLKDVGGGDLGKMSLRNEGDPDSGVLVPVLRLDEILRGAGEVSVVKVDVEGFEPEVLLGASDVLSSGRTALVIELSPAWYVDRVNKARQAFSFLLDLPMTWYEVRADRIHPFELGRWVGSLGTDTTQRDIVGVPHERRPVLVKMQGSVETGAR